MKPKIGQQIVGGLKAMAGASKGAGEALGVLLLAVVGGLALASILDYFNKPSCPVCRKKIEQGITPCPHCRTVLRWT